MIAANCTTWTGRTLTDERARVSVTRCKSGIWKTDMHPKERGRFFGVMLPWSTCWCEGFDGDGKLRRSRIWRIWFYLPWFLAHIDFDLRTEADRARTLPRRFS